MEDICIACSENLATVLFDCGHRVYCDSCCENVRIRGRGRVMCPMDRRIVQNSSDSTCLQLQPVSLGESLVLYNVLQRQYPCGCLLFGPDPLPATENLFDVVREAIEAVRAENLTIEEFQRSLSRRLTGEQYQLVYVELMKNADLRGVIQKYEVKKNETKVMLRYVREVIVTMVEKADDRAILMRAGLETVIDGAIIGVKAAMKVASSSTSAVLNSNGVSNIIAFSLFSALEIYRWSRGDITTQELWENIGEHTVGATAGFVGGWGGMVAGGAAGAAVGSVVPVIGTAIGATIGAIVGSILTGLVCDYAGRTVYRKFVPRRAKSEQVRSESFEQPLTPKEMAEKAATRLGVNLTCHTFSEAQMRFRKKLLRARPDKNPDASDERLAALAEETRDFLACWAILREYYKDIQQDETMHDNDAAESYIDILVLKARDTIDGAWTSVRYFFDVNSLGRPPREGYELVETRRIFV